jgi:hypothetical protein
MVALAARGQQGRGLRARRHPPFCRARDGTGSHHSALPAPLLGPGTDGKRPQSSQTLLAIGSARVPSLRGQAVPAVIPCGRLRVAGPLAPCGVQDHPMGRSDSGDDPITPPHTRCPCPRVHRWRQDIAPLVVPGSVSAATHSDRAGARALDVTGGVSTIESPGRFHTM